VLLGEAAQGGEGKGAQQHKIGRIVGFLEKPHQASDKDLAALVRD
jgi:hypothetical protein